MSRKPPRLICTARVDLPVVEASGLASRTIDGELRVIVVGDRTADVGTGRFLHDEELTDRHLTDLSEIDGWELPPDDSQLEAVGPDRALWLLSDQSATLGCLRLKVLLPAEGGTIRAIDDAWRLPKGTVKPEGLVALGNEQTLIAMDTGKQYDNGMIVELPPSGAGSPRGS